MKRNIFAVSLVAFLSTPAAFAATAINLSHQPISTLVSVERTAANVQMNLQQLNVHIDANQTAHIRVQQTFSGVPVWGADAVLHVPNGGARSLKNFLVSPDSHTQMNGTIYRGLESDLNLSPESVFTSGNADRLFNQATKIYHEKIGKEFTISHSKVVSIVYLDQSNKAHWAYHISFDAKTPASRAMPNFIMDAVTGTVYKQWNNLQNILTSATGGGFGGNPKTGKFTYDGLKSDLTSLSVMRDPGKGVCFLNDKDVVVKNVDKSDAISTFDCKGIDPKHKEYWDNTLNTSHGAYSPDNDALYIGDVIQKMYREWYNVPALTKDGKPMLLVMRTHDTGDMADNAYWDGQQMTFGDGDGVSYYPFVSMTVGAHEVSHGFTEQHSNLQYDGQSGGLNESFSDMASMAAEFYAYGKSSWLLGWEIPKAKGQVIRYMDQPSKDCLGGLPPGTYCSIDKASQYTDGLDVHFSSGVFNRAFYLLSTTAGWNTHKAFDVMVKANQDYWTSTTTFQDAACGVVKAAQDLKYDLTAVNAALKAVDLDSTTC